MSFQQRPFDSSTLHSGTIDNGPVNSFMAPTETIGTRIPGKSEDTSYTTHEVYGNSNASRGYLQRNKKLLVLVGIVLLVLIAIGGGLGGYFGTRDNKNPISINNATSSGSSSAIYPSSPSATKASSSSLPSAQAQFSSCVNGQCPKPGICDNYNRCVAQACSVQGDCADSDVFCSINNICQIVTCDYSEGCELALLQVSAAPALATNVVCVTWSGYATSTCSFAPPTTTSSANVPSIISSD